MSDTFPAPGQEGRTAAAVLQIVPSLSGGGAERSTLEIAQALADARWRAVVASSGGALTPSLEACGAQHVRLPMHVKNPPGLAVNAVRLARLIRREGIDLVHVRSRAPAWSALFAARAARVPLVATWHGRVAPAALPMLPAPKVFYASALVRGQALIANSAYTAARLRAVYGARLPRLETIPRGVDASHFNPARVPEAAVAARRASWGAGTRPVLLMPARLTRGKGHLWLLEALARLDPGLRPLTVCVGRAPRGRRGAAYRKRLRAQIAALGLDGSVRLAGPEQDMVAAYAAASLVIAPSLRPEAFGRTAVEAQAMMRPVIVADHGGAQETVRRAAPGSAQDTATGWRVRPGDADALAGALRAAMTLTPEAHRAMGCAGRAFVAERFPLDAMCAATLALYREILPRAAGCS